VRPSDFLIRFAQDRSSIGSLSRDAGQLLEVRVIVAAGDRLRSPAANCLRTQKLISA
jgi:hypothetical protein